MHVKNGSKDLKRYPQISRRVRDTLAPCQFPEVVCGFLTAWMWREPPSRGWVIPCGRTGTATLSTSAGTAPHSRQSGANSRPPSCTTTTVRHLRLRGQDSAFALCFRCLRGQDSAFALRFYCLRGQASASSRTGDDGPWTDPDDFENVNLAKTVAPAVRDRSSTATCTSLCVSPPASA